jgi:hypothetical protein
MPTTYRAILKGNQIIWLDSPPCLPEGTEVLVTLSTVVPRSDGRKMAETLENLAARHAFADIDPVQWQRDIRRDRPLHGRGD